MSNWLAQGKRRKEAISTSHLRVVQMTSKVCLPPLFCSCQQVKARIGQAMLSAQSHMAHPKTPINTRARMAPEMMGRGLSVLVLVLGPEEEPVDMLVVGEQAVRLCMLASC